MSRRAKSFSISNVDRATGARGPLVLIRATSPEKARRLYDSLYPQRRAVAATLYGGL